MARMLMPDPPIVMLDEPFAGVHPVLCKFMIERIEEMSGAGKAVLLISHDLTSIYRLSTRVVALNQGKVIAEGGVDDIRGNPAVIEAYLGT
jgi:branched-chain amino acid transport system ATP-binding protein